MKRRLTRPTAGCRSGRVGLEALEARFLLSDSPYRPPAPADAVDRAAEAAVISLKWKGREVQARENQFILRLDAKSAAVDAMTNLQRAVARKRDDLKIIRKLDDSGNTVLLESSGGTDALAIKKSLKGLRGFRYVEPNFVYHVDALPDDPRLGELWGLNNAGQTGGHFDSDIDAPEAWDISHGDGSVVIGVIDTGVKYDHPDLAANIYTNPGEIPDNDYDDDGNGFVDDVHGWDFIGNGDNDPMDEHGHGTHVAGTIAAVGNNGVGISGVNWDAKIMPLRFLDANGFGDNADAVDALRYATMMRERGVNIRLTNNSWAGGAYSQAMRDAIAASGDAGMLFIAAAGNFGVDGDVSPNYPSAFDLPNVIAVAAVDHNDRLASFSNYGAHTIDLAAPGVDVLSTVPFSGGEYFNASGYRRLSGTSMATPHVSGAAALAWSVAPDASFETVRDALLSGGDAVPELAQKTITGKRLNALGTLRRLGMRVVTATPGEGAVVGAPPTDFLVRFTFPFVSDPALPGGLQPGDLRVNGIAASSVTAPDAKSALFHFDASPVSAQGRQVMKMNAAAVRRADDGAALNPFVASFRYDVSPLAVTGSSVAEGTVVTAPSFGLRLDFNEPLNRARLDPTDLRLSQGTVNAARLIGDRSIQFFISGLANEGALTLSLPAGVLGDVYGNPNDAYSLSVDVDRTVVAFAPPLVRAAPRGSLAWRSEPAPGVINFVDDVDRYALDLLPNQSLSAWATPSEGLTPIVWLEAPDGSRLDQATAIRPGAEALLQTRIAAGGRYIIAVAGASGSGGDYALHVALNLSEETERHDGASNDIFTTPQNVDALLIQPVDGVRRAAVRGRLANDDDYFSLTLHVGERLDVVATKLNGPGALIGPRLYFQGALQAAAVGDGIANVISGFTAVAEGTYVVVLPAVQSGIDYALSLSIDASTDIEPNDNAFTPQPLRGATRVVGYAAAGAPALTREQEPNDAGASASLLAGFRLANDLSAAFVSSHGSTYAAAVSGNISSESDVDYYRFYARPGDQLLATLTRTDISGELDPYLRIFDRDGNQLLVDDDSGEGNNASLAFGAFAYAGEYYIAAEGFRLSVGDYRLAATLQTTRLTTSRDSDFYSFTAAAGDAIRIEARPVASGAAELSPPLIPALSIFHGIGSDPILTGVVSAQGNGELDFVAEEDGVYIVNVAAGGSTQGGYALTLQGATQAAPPFAVREVNPGSGSVVGPRQAIVVDFTSALRLATLQASDLRIDGIAANAVEAIDGDSAAFSIAPLSAGEHEISLSPRALLDLAGQPFRGFTSRFTLDDAGPRVTASSIAPGQSAPAGALVYTVQFNEPIARAALDATDVRLVGAAAGPQRASISYDAATRTLTARYADLPEDVYTMSLNSAAGGIADLVGNRLDGELRGPLGAGSGDGVAGGDFTFSFSTDAAAHVFSTPEAVAPAGLGVYRSTGAALLAVPGDSDSFEIPLAAGQTISILANVSDDLRPRMDLRDPDGTLLASAAAPAAGVSALLEAKAARTGTYLLELSGADGSVGRANVELTRNAQNQAAELPGRANAVRGAALDLEPLTMDLGGGVRRAAVHGSLDPDAPAGLTANFEGLALGPSWSTYSSTSGGRVRLLNKPSAAQGIQSLWMDAASSTPTLNEAVWKVNLAGVARPMLNFAHGSSDDELHSFAVDRFVGHINADGIAVSADGVRWHLIWQAPLQARDAWQRYAIDLRAAAEASGLQLGDDVRIKFQQYDDREIPNDGRGWDDISITPAPGVARHNWYSVALAAGETATMALATSGDGQLELYDAAGSLVSAGAATATNLASVIDGFVAPSAGIYYLRVAGTAGDYTLGAVHGAAFDSEPNDSPASAQPLGSNRAVLGHLGAAAGVIPSAATSAAAAPSLPLTLVDGDGFSWDIQSDGSIQDGTRDAFDGGMAHVGFTGPADVASEQGGREISIGPAPVASVQITRKIYVPADRGFARYLEIITNPTDSTVGYLVRLSSNLGSDNATVVVGTSNGDSAFTIADNWVVTDDSDDNDGDGDPPVTHVLSGIGGQQRPVYAALFGGELEYDYSLELGPGQTRIVMHFAVQNEDRAAALAKGASLMALGLGATAGMTSQELGAVVNFNLANPADFYTRTLAAGETVRVRTSTPDDDDIIGNELDAKLEVRGPDGALAARDDDSASDGRNAELTFTAAAAGVYTFVVRATNSTSGEYLLRIDPAPPPAPLTPRLLPQTDSGASASDGLTNFNNADAASALLFEVAGVTPGSVVTLYADGAPIGQALADGSSVAIATSGAQRLGDGEHIFTATQQVAGRVQSAASQPRAITVDTARPGVAGVVLSGSSWASSFLNYLREQNLGDGGFHIPTSGDELTPLPWVNVDQISLGFTERVQGIAQLRSSAGDPIAAGLASGGALVWTLGSPLSSGRYAIESSGLTDLAGNAIGFGTIARFSVVDGDVSRDGRVDAADLVQLRNRVGLTTASAGYRPFDDVNGDGAITAIDLLAVRKRIGTALPPL